MGWWADLGLNWKYCLVFMALIALTIVVGAVKWVYNRSKLRQLSVERTEKMRVNDDRLALTQRDKDEGDLFGVRALEAGYFGGVTQSRPASQCTSRNTSISGNTLIGTSPTPKLISPAGSVTKLPRVQRNKSNKSLPSIPRVSAPLQIKLQPSEAEINGRKTHGGLDMSLNVPPSPTAPKSVFFSPANRDGSQASARTSPDLLAPVRNMHDPSSQPVVERVPRMAPFRSESDLNTKSMAVSVDFTIGGSSTTEPSSPTNWPPSPNKISSHYFPRRSISPTDTGRETQKRSTQSNIKTQPANPSIPNYTFPTNVYMARQSLYSSESDKGSTSSRHSRNLSDGTIDRGFPCVQGETTTTGESSARSTSTQSRRFSFHASTPETSLPTGSPNEPHLSDFFEAYFRQSHSSLDGKLDLSGGADMATGSRLSEMTRAPSPGMMPPRLSPKNSKRAAPVGRAL